MPYFPAVQIESSSTSTTTANHIETALGDTSRLN
jgi:hypothetical protein